MNPSLHFFRISALLPAFLVTASLLRGADKPSLNEHLEPFRPFLGKTWRGEFKDSKPDKRVIDVARWERALNGQAIRVVHSINDGAYGGESLIHWDPEKKVIAYHYFTTAGFTTSGTMAFDDGRITASEKVAGNTNGITEVRSVSEIRPDGTMRTSARYLNQDGKTVGSREVLYQEDSKAEVKFR